MKRILLTRGKFALVDDIDYYYLMQWKWQFNGRYACRSFRFNGKFCNQLMHRLILERKLGRPIHKNMVNDHYNEDGSDPDKLNNCRSHLREATKTQNAQNRKGGVCFVKQNSKWRVAPKVGNNNLFLGYYKNRNDAQYYYNKWAKDYYKKFVRLFKLPLDYIPIESQYISLSQRKSSKYIGVHWFKNLKKWRWEIEYHGTKYSGFNVIEIEAAKERERVAIKLNKRYDTNYRLNFINKEI